MHCRIRSGKNGWIWSGLQSRLRSVADCNTATSRAHMSPHFMWHSAWIIANVAIQVGIILPGGD